MKKTYEIGSYVKAYGGDFGLYFDGKKWVSFECLGCAIAQGLVIPNKRLQGIPGHLSKKIGYNFEIKHDKIFIIIGLKTVKNN